MRITKIKSQNFSKSTFKNDGTLEKGPKSSVLVLKIEDTFEEFLNCIRRAILNHVPTYAFCRDNINITKNTTNINNDMLSLTISQLPIFDVETQVFYLKDKYYNRQHASQNSNKIKQENTNIKHKNDTKNINMKITVKNNSNDVMYLTTKDVELYVNDKLTNSYDKTDHILLIKMSPKSEIICSAQGVLGIGYNNDIWAAGTCYYNENEDGSYNFTVKSCGQCTEQVLLKNVCKYVYKKLKDLSKLVSKKFADAEHNDKTQYIIIFDDEDFTCLPVINYFIQNDKNVVCSGITRERFDIDTVTLKIIINNSNIGDIFNTAIGKCNDLFKKFESEIANI